MNARVRELLRQQAEMQQRFDERLAEAEAEAGRLGKAAKKLGKAIEVDAKRLMQWGEVE